MGFPLGSAQLSLSGHVGTNPVSSLIQKTDQHVNKLFRINLHIGRGSNLDMPKNLVGAYVAVFVGAVDHESAAFTAVSAIRDRGYEFIDISDGQIHELDPQKWNSFVLDAWPDFVVDFPDQSHVIDSLTHDFLFIGPFASYERPM